MSELAKFDPKQPRDPRTGQWVEIPGIVATEQIGGETWYQGADGIWSTDPNRDQTPPDPDAPIDRPEDQPSDREWQGFGSPGQGDLTRPPGTRLWHITNDPHLVEDWDWKVRKPVGPAAYGGLLHLTDAESIPNWNQSWTGGRSWAVEVEIETQAVGRAVREGWREWRVPASQLRPIRQVRIEDVVKRFDPHQPRDPHTGEWIEIGITPALGGFGSRADAALAWSEPAFQGRALRFEEAAREALPGVEAEHQLGLWEGEWEPSYSLRVRGKPEAIHAAASKLGDRFEQFGVVSFAYSKRGEDVELQMHGDDREIEQALRAARIPGASFGKGGASIFFANDPDSGEQLQRLLDELDRRRIDYSHAYGTFRLHENVPARALGKLALDGAPQEGRPDRGADAPAQALVELRKARTRRAVVSAMRLGKTDETRFAQRFLGIKLSAYRQVLGGLAARFGEARQPKLSAEIRQALAEEADRDARSVVATMNKLASNEAARHPELSPDQLTVHLSRFLRERGRKRAALIAKEEPAAARLDALVQFFRENGVDPQFDFHGPKPQCPVCEALLAHSPWPASKVVRVGRPHIGCTHSWRLTTRGGGPVAALREALRAGGERPGRIAVGREGTAGIVGQSTFVHLHGRDQEAAEVIAALAEVSEAQLVKSWREYLHPRDAIGRFIETGAPGGPGSSREEPITVVAERHRRLQEAADRAFKRWFEGEVVSSSGAASLQSKADEAGADVRFHPEGGPELEAMISHGGMSAEELQRELAPPELEVRPTEMGHWPWELEQRDPTERERAEKKTLEYAQHRGLEMGRDHGYPKMRLEALSFSSRRPDSNGVYSDEDSRVELGQKVEESEELLAEARKPGAIPLARTRARWGFVSLNALQHEIAHAVNPQGDDALRKGGGLAMEEALTEEVARVFTVEELKRRGDRDVLIWLKQGLAGGEGSGFAKGTYQELRSRLRGCLVEAGIPESEWRETILRMKFEMTSRERNLFLGEKMLANGALEAKREQILRWQNLARDVDEMETGDSLLVVNSPFAVSQVEGGFKITGQELRQGLTWAGSTHLPSDRLLSSPEDVATEIYGRSERADRELNLISEVAFRIQPPSLDTGHGALRVAGFEPLIDLGPDLADVPDKGRWEQIELDDGSILELGDPVEVTDYDEKGQKLGVVTGITHGATAPIEVRIEGETQEGEKIGSEVPRVTTFEPARVRKQAELDMDGYPIHVGERVKLLLEDEEREVVDIEGGRDRYLVLAEVGRAIRGDPEDETYWRANQVELVDKRGEHRTAEGQLLEVGQTVIIGGPEVRERAVIIDFDGPMVMIRRADGSEVEVWPGAIGGVVG